MLLDLNGKNIEVDNGLSLLEFVSSRGLEPERIVIELNYKIINKNEWSKTFLKENDNLEVLRFVGGG